MEYLRSKGVGFGEGGIIHSTAMHRRNYWCTESRYCMSLLNRYRENATVQGLPMERIKYKGYFIDKTKTGYRISKQSDISIHTHLRNLSTSYKLINNVVNKPIPKRCGLYYLESHIRIANDEEYKRKLQDYYDVKVNKGTKQRYYNPHKKSF